MLEATNLSNKTQIVPPDYLLLANFLLSPFLESQETLSIDCEQYNHNQRVWIRLAVEGEEKGRIYGRGGRNIQAIRTVLATAAAAAGQSLFLDLYESESSKPKRRDNRDEDDFDRPDSRRRKEGDRRPNSSRFSNKPRF
jgi:uncharacterized protein